MRRIFVVAVALMSVAIFATSSYAANRVNMTLTSPTIYKSGCEKAGSTTYEFDAGSTINAGDWWYMDLPENITLCKNYDFIVAGAAAGTAAPNVTINAAALPYQNVVFNTGAGIGAIAAATVTGPLTIGGNNPANPTITNQFAFLVKGTSGQRRITIYALTSPAVADVPSLVVAADCTLQLKIFDGAAWSLTDGTIGANGNRILTDDDGDGTYGEIGALVALAGNEVIGNVNTADVTIGAPYVENTLCINAEAMSGQYVYTSYASKLDKFTFSGDSQIAHTATAGSIALASCKDSDQFDIEVDSAQGATQCWFDYEATTSGTNGNYCDTGWPSVEEQRFLIEATSGAFGDIGDKYTITAEITSPSNGVYFGGTPAVTLIKSTQDECNVAGTAPTTAPVWVGTDDSGDTVTGYNGGDCSVDDDEMAVKLTQTGTSAITLDGYDTIYVNFADFVFMNTAVDVGEEVTVELTLNRYPCGEIFSDSRTIGTFVAECGTVAGTMTIRFPWLPGSDAAGWWGGFVIANFGASEGTATLTYRDSAGATATYTTDAIAAGSQWVSTAITEADLTDVDGYDAALNFSVQAVCGFTARGFAFTGNGEEGTGYVVSD